MHSAGLMHSAASCIVRGLIHRAGLIHRMGLMHRAASYIGASWIVWPTTLIHSASLTLDNSGASYTAGLVPDRRIHSAGRTPRGSS